MPSQEQLIQIRSLTGEARSKANQTIDQYSEHRYRHKYQTQTRVNRINALPSVNFGGSYTFEVPSHGQVMGEMSLVLDLPALDGQNYKAYAAMRIVDKIIYRAGGNQFYEYKPAEVAPLLINRARDADHKEKLKALWGNSAAANAQRVLIPLILPWSVWNSEKMMRPLEHGVRGQTLWDGSRLSKNLVIEIQMASKAQATTDAASAFAGNTTNLGGVQLFREEIVATKSTLDAIRSEIPDTFYAEEYTRLNNQTINSDGTDLTNVNVSTLTSRAGTKGFYFICRSAAEAATDNPFTSDDRLREVRLELDGREVASTEGQPSEVQEYLALLAGKKTLPEPNFANFTFGNDESAALHAQTYSGLLKNQAVNETVLRLAAKVRNPQVVMQCDIVAVHPRQYTFVSGGVRASNCY